MSNSKLQPVLSFDISTLLVTSEEILPPTSFDFVYLNFVSSWRFTTAEIMQLLKSN